MATNVPPVARQAVPTGNSVSCQDYSADALIYSISYCVRRGSSAI